MYMSEPPVPSASLQLRQDLTAAGYDAGAQNIATHLTGRLELVPSVTTMRVYFCSGT